MTTLTHATGNGSMTVSATLSPIDGQDGEGNAQRWLYELEHASLTQGQAATATVRSAPRQTSVPAGVPALQVAPIHLMPQVAPSWSRTGPVSAVVDPLPPSGARQQLPATVTPRADRATDVSGSGQQLPLLTPPPTATTALAARVSLGMQRAATPATFTEAQKQVQQYAPQNLHVYADGDSLQVWVRDARLAPEAAESLRASMVDGASRAGGKTVRISINGKPGSEPEPDAPMTLPIKTGLIF